MSRRFGNACPRIDCCCIIMINASCYNHTCNTDRYGQQLQIELMAACLASPPWTRRGVPCVPRACPRVRRLFWRTSGERLSWGRTAHARHASTGLLKVEEQWEQQRCSVFEVPEGQANGEQGQADVKYTPVANDVTEKFFTF